MALIKTMLRPVARLAALHAARDRNAFLKAHRRTASQQADFLRRLLARHAETAFGRDHSFTSIDSPDAYRRAVPVRRYEELTPWMDRVWGGETSALLPADQPVLMFSLSSGTTGEPKVIPVTPRHLENIRRGWNIWGLAMLTDHKEAWLRPILQISSPMREQDSPTGLACGAISGLLAKSQKRIVRWMYCVPRWVTQLTEPVDKFYATLRCTIERDVSMITTANPSSTLKMIEIGRAHSDLLLRDLREGTITLPVGELPAAGQGWRTRPNKALADRLGRAIQRDGQLRPEQFWQPACLNNWTGGTLGLYIDRLREVFGAVPVRDIGLVASEGRLNIPLADETPAGPAEILGNFLEFIPADCYDQPNPPTVLAHECEVGREYFVVMSNYAGLFRYSLDDRVCCTGQLDQTCVIEFLSRGKHTVSITGEKLTEHQVVEAMARTREQLGLPCERFFLQGVFAAEPYYRLQAEAPQDQAEPLAQIFDEQLSKLNIEYESKRKSGRLGPVQAHGAPPAEFDRREQNLIAQRKGRTEQYKHQYLLTDIEKE
jgi:hypothetical protein